MGLFLLGCLLTCLYCYSPQNGSTTDHLWWLIELIVRGTSSLDVCLRLFFSSSLSKDLLLGQFICRYSSKAVHPWLFFLGYTSAAVLLKLLDCMSVAVLLKISDCMSATVLLRPLGFTSASILLGLFACS